MGVEIRGNDGGITTIATDDSNTGSALQIDTVIGGVSGTAFAINSPAGQVRVNAIKSGAYPAGLALVNPTTTVNDLTNSLVLYVVAGFTGANEAYFEDFTASGAHASVMLADDVISADVANGWVISRGLKVNVGTTSATVGGLVGTAINVTGKTNSLAITNLLASAPVGTYTLQLYIEDETAGGGTVAPFVNFHNSNGATTVALSVWNGAAQVSTITLNGAVALDFSSVFQLYNFTAGNISISTVAVGTVQYSIRARLFRID